MKNIVNEEVSQSIATDEILLGDNTINVNAQRIFAQWNLTCKLTYYFPVAFQCGNERVVSSL